MRTLAILAASLVLLVACKTSESGPATSTPAAETRLVITGASTIAPLAAEIGKRFEAKHPGVRVDVQTGGSARGVNDTLQGLANVGMVSRPLKPEEESSGLLGHPIARDGVGVIVHAGNPLTKIDKAALVAIYSGKTRSWKALGGKDGPITVVNKAEGRSTLELFAAYVGLKTTDITSSVVIGDNEQGIKTVAGNPGAIGYVSIGTAEHDIRSGVTIKLLEVDGVAATTSAVAEGSFPISRPLNLVTKGEPTGLAREFIELAQSDEVHDLVEAQFFVPLGPAGG